MTPLSPIQNLFAIEVPEDALPDEWKIFEVDGENYLNGMTADGEMYAGLESLPPGSYEISFPTLSATEQQAAGVVEGNYYPSSPAVFGFEDYEHYGYFSCETALESLQSLLRSNGLDLSKNYLLIKKTT